MGRPPDIPIALPGADDHHFFTTYDNFCYPRRFKSHGQLRRAMKWVFTRRPPNSRVAAPERGIYATVRSKDYDCIVCCSKAPCNIVSNTLREEYDVDGYFGTGPVQNDAAEPPGTLELRKCTVDPVNRSKRVALNHFGECGYSVTAAVCNAGAQWRANILRFDFLEEHYIYKDADDNNKSHGVDFAHTGLR